MGNTLESPEAHTKNWTRGVDHTLESSDAHTKKKTARKDAPHMVVPGPLIILVCRSLDHTLEGYDDAHTRIFKKCAKARSTFAAPWTSFVGPT